MNHITTKSSLPIAGQRLVETMQRLNFGRIEGLAVRGGLPAFSLPCRVIRDIKIGGDNGARPEVDQRDFVLKDSVVELFEHFAELGDGTVEVLEVRHGLPTKLVIQQVGSEVAE